jgi:hypothetical protein
MAQEKTTTQAVLEVLRSLRVSVKIPHDEVDRLVVTKLIAMREQLCIRNEEVSYLDKTLRCFLSEEEFEKYVIKNQQIQ